MGFVNNLLCNFRDPGIVPRGNLNEIEFDKNDKELNLYGNYEDIDESNVSNDESTREDILKKRKLVPRIY